VDFWILNHFWGARMSGNIENERKKLITVKMKE